MPSARRLAQHERLLQPVAGNAELVRYGQLRPAHVCLQPAECPSRLALPGRNTRAAEGRFPSQGQNVAFGVLTPTIGTWSLGHARSSKSLCSLAIACYLEGGPLARHCYLHHFMDVAPLTTNP